MAGLLESGQDAHIGLGVPPQVAAYMQSQLSQPGGGMYAWHTPYLSDASSSGAEGSGGLPDGLPGVDWLPQHVAFNPEWLQSIGFDYGTTDVWGNRAIAEGGGENAGGPSPALLQYLADRGLQLRVRQLPGANAGQAQYFDPAGNPVGMTVSNTLDPDKEFAIGSKIMMAIMTGGAAAAGLGSMGGTIGSGLGLGSGAFSTAVGNGLLNAGMTAATGGDVGQALQSGALSAGGAYLGQQVGGGGLSNTLVPGAGTIEPGFFAPGGAGEVPTMSDFGLGDFDYSPINANDWGSYMPTDTPAAGIDMMPSGLTSTQIDLQTGNYGSDTPYTGSVPDSVDLGSLGGIISTNPSFLDGLKNLLGGLGGKVTSGGAAFNNPLRDILGMVGSGINQAMLERMARDQRDWQAGEAQKSRDFQTAERERDRAYQDRKEGEKLARQAPVGLLESRIRVIPGARSGA